MVRNLVVGVGVALLVVSCGTSRSDAEPSTKVPTSTTIDSSTTSVVPSSTTTTTLSHDLGVWGAPADGQWFNELPIPWVYPVENMFSGRTEGAPCTDASNAELYGKDLSGAIICTPTTVGSTMGGMTLMGMKAIGVGPEALLFSNPIDTLAAAGVLMTDIWDDKQITTIDMLGDEFLETVQMGDPIAIRSDGTVEIG